MSGSHDRWTNQLSEYLDGSLSEDAQARIADHLSGCETCRAVLDDLESVMEGARALQPFDPPRDLWPEIAASIGVPRSGGNEGEGDVIALPLDRVKSGGSGPSGLFLSVPQLAAAAVLLIVFSVAATWFAGPGLAVRQVAEPIPVVPSPSATLASDVPAPPAELAPELEALEEVLDSARVRLDANTVRIIERNLAVVEQAIEDSFRALALDPENEFLAGHLDRVFQRKLEYLREAARVVEWSG